MGNWYRDQTGEWIYDPEGDTAHDRNADGIPDHLQDTDELAVIDSGLPTGVPDTGDVIDPGAADPTPEEITHPDHPDYVEPWTGE